MLDWFQEMLMSRNVIALAITAVIAVLLVRLIFNAGKVVLVSLGIVGLGAVVYYWFPEYWQGFFREVNKLLGL